MFDRLRRVEAEQRAARVAGARLEQSASRDPNLLAGTNVDLVNLRWFLSHVEGTYIVRMFAEFEAELRYFWQRARKGRRWPRAAVETLINRVAAVQNIPNDRIVDVHDVRETRNDLLHSGLERAGMSFQECRSRLGRFLQFLPYRWLFRPLERE